MNYGESQKRMLKQPKVQSQKTRSTQTQLKSSVITQENEYRVESWTRQEIKELVEDMNWNTNQDKGYLE